MAKEKKRRRFARAAGQMAKRAGSGFAKRFKEKRARGAMVSLATAAAAGYYNGGTNISDQVLWKKEGETPTEKDLTKVDAVGLVAGAAALWTGNAMLHDVAMGLLPVTVYRMVEARSRRGYGGRPPKAEGVTDDVGADDDGDVFAGAVDLDDDD